MAALRRGRSPLRPGRPPCAAALGAVVRLTRVVPVGRSAGQTDHADTCHGPWQSPRCCPRRCLPALVLPRRVDCSDTPPAADPRSWQGLTVDRGGVLAQNILDELDGGDYSTPWNRWRRSSALADPAEVSIRGGKWRALSLITYHASPRIAAAQRLVVRTGQLRPGGRPDELAQANGVHDGQQVTQHPVGRPRNLLPRRSRRTPAPGEHAPGLSDRPLGPDRLEARRVCRGKLLQHDARPPDTSTLASRTARSRCRGCGACLWAALPGRGTRPCLGQDAELLSGHWPIPRCSECFSLGSAPPQVIQVDLNAAIGQRAAAQQAEARAAPPTAAWPQWYQAAGLRTGALRHLSARPAPAARQLGPALSHVGTREPAVESRGVCKSGGR